jgi:serine/threonine-protein kinase ATR
MMNTLGEDEIAALVDPTFAILVQHWRLFGSGIQGQAYDMIDHLMKTHSTMICDIVHTLPSLSSIPLMAKFEGQLDALKSRMDVKHHFIAFSQRCQNENATVAVTALRELAEYLTEHQGFLHEAANSEQPDTVVSQLIRSILDTSVLFSSTNLEISVLCAKCLGLVGCLDPTRIEATREKREILVLSNFVRNDETNDFVIFFLREVLVKAFLSATNSRSQGFLAYAMQELLSISAIREAVISRSRDGPHDANYRRWVSLPESVRTTLMPFTDSKYFVTAGVSQPPCTYPLYSGEMSHGHWLRAITFDLLKRKLGTGKVQTIFSVLSRIVRFQDISISNFLLPFACLNVIVNGEDHDRREIGRELLQILLHSLPDQAPRRDNVILCSQVSVTNLSLNFYLFTLFADGIPSARLSI